MATNKPAEQTLFVRKASGLVKGWSTGDGFRYSFFSTNMFLGIWGFPTPCSSPAAACSGCHHDLYLRDFELWCTGPDLGDATSRR